MPDSIRPASFRAARAAAFILIVCAAPIACVILGAVFPARAEIELNLINRVPLIDAAGRGDVEKVRGFLLAGQNPNAVDIDGRTAVMLAAYGNHPVMVSLLVDAKARCDAKDKNGITALQIAAERGYEDVLVQLLRCKANLNLDNREGTTPAMFAAQKGQLRVLQLLVQAGADLTLQDRTGRTALEWAELNNRRTVVDFLRRSGVKS